MRIRGIEHVEHETPGSIAEWAAERGHGTGRTRLWAGDPLPDLDSFDWLVVMGGPMSVKDEAEYPWLVREKWLVVQAIAARRLVLGVCLGAQIVAEVLGADVTECPTAEIGWYPVRLTPAVDESHVTWVLPERFVPLHWHGETFSLPAHAVRVTESERCRDQAFEGARSLAYLLLDRMAARADTDEVEDAKDARASTA